MSSLTETTGFMSPHNAGAGAAVVGVGGFDDDDEQAERTPPRNAASASDLLSVMLFLRIPRVRIRHSRAREDVDISRTWDPPLPSCTDRRRRRARKGRDERTG